MEVYVDGAFVGTATSGIRRDDRCSLYPNRPGCPIVGFRYAWDTLSHSNGTHTVRLVAFDSDNPQKSSAVERSVTVNNASPEPLRIAPAGLVEMNLAAVPFDAYTYVDQAQGYVPNCPAGVSVRTCYQAALWNYRAQGVTGVRVMFAFCGAGSTALSSCTSGYQGITVREEWKSRINDFLSDVRESGLQRVALSPIFWGWNWSTSPPYTDFGDTECSTGPVRLYWEPTVPFGHTLEGYNPDGTPKYYPFPGFGHNQGWNCSPQNPYFVGWDNLYNVINAVLERAQSNSLVVSELNVQQELNLSGFTVLARFITDNKHGHTGNLLAII